MLAFWGCRTSTSNQNHRRTLLEEVTEEGESPVAEMVEIVEVS